MGKITKKAWITLRPLLRWEVKKGQSHVGQETRLEKE